MSGRVDVLAVLQAQAVMCEESGQADRASEIWAIRAIAAELIAVAECTAALGKRFDIGAQILECNGWDRNDRFDLPATEFVQRKAIAILSSLAGASQ